MTPDENATAAAELVTNEGYTLSGLGTINILLGKNGSGKSTVLRDLNRTQTIPNRGIVTYITPERAGALNYDPGVEQQVQSSATRLGEMRASNQHFQFKQQTIIQYRKLRDVVLSEMEKAVTDKTPHIDIPVFADQIGELNSLLDAIVVSHVDGKLVTTHRTKGHVSPTDISSGESELIALGIESLLFEKQAVSGRVNLLLLDEPDVHLHPDLQARLMAFLVRRVACGRFQILLTTHSTAILGALADRPGVKVAFMRGGDKEIVFQDVDDRLRKILPMFGAHPLSNLFVQAPLLLLEGDDDERIWQQAVRTSNGKIRLYPCVCGTVSEIGNYEQEVREITAAVYDKPLAYSLRDGDGSLDDLDDETPIVRLRLRCYASENLLLTDEVLTSLECAWPELVPRLEEWLAKNPSHPHFADMIAFKESGYDRRQHKIKNIRNDLMGIIGSSKPWEVAIGQVIGTTTRDQTTVSDSENTLASYLGRKTVAALLPPSQLP